METTEGKITTLEEGCTVESTLFTYSEEEREEQKINKMNADLILKPQFITLDYAMLHKGYSRVETALYGFIKFFLANNEKFYCSNEQLAEMLCVSEKTVSLAMKKLIEDGLIETTLKIKSNGGRIRFVRLSAEITKSNFPKLQNVISEITKSNGIYNKVIENKKENILKERKTIPSVSELVDAYKADDKLSSKIKDADVIKERAEYKQSKKDRAYKTIKGFLQQLVVNVNKVSNGEIRYDVNLRLRFALNQTIEKERKDIYWNDNIEREYQGWKKIYLLEQKENE